MKKTLIAIAALAATGAFAQSSLTISGQMDVGYAHTTSAGNAAIAAVAATAGVSTGTTAVAAASSITTRGMNTGIHGASRLRFVGAEDLGGGMKANFWLEMQPAFTDGTTSAALFNRGAWAGISSSTWGEVRLGRQGTNTMAAICTVDQQGCYSGFSGGGLLFSGNSAPGSVGAAWIAANPTRGYAANTAAATAQASSTGGDSTRYVKAIRYSLPTLAAGLSVNLTTAFGGQNATTGAAGGGSTGLDATYAVGPFAAIFTYQTAAAEAVANSSSGTLTTIGGTYDLKTVKLGALVQRESASATGSTVLAYDSAKAYALTAVMPMGAWSPYVKMGNRSYVSGGNSVTPTKVFNLGTRYALSKKTNLYADYARNNAAVADISGSATANPKQISFGMQTAF